MSDHPMSNVVEAVLLAAGRPVTVEQIQELFEEHERPPAEDVLAALEGLAQPALHHEPLYRSGIHVRVVDVQGAAALTLGSVQGGIRRINQGTATCDFFLDGSEFTDFLLELHAFVGVLHGSFDTFLGAAHATGR